jgi:hypothetical protein
MANGYPRIDLKSASDLAFEHYLRTGQRLTAAEFASAREVKYNHNHDELGRFTFAWNRASGRRTPDRIRASAAKPSSHVRAHPTAVIGRSRELLSSIPVHARRC